MKTKNKLLTLLILSAGATSAIAAINKLIQVTATSKNLTTDSQSLCYKWRFGNIHYTKCGSGKPLLLIHDLNAASSGYEWHQLIPKLRENYTVYTIDLLGCGRSEKCAMTYTNYLYVQLISDFIKSEIGHRTNVIATGESASIPVMACANNPDLFDQLMLISPLSLQEYSQIPGKTSKIYKLVIDFPILGTFFYHIATSKKAIREYLTDNCFYNPYSVKASYVDVCHESANLGSSPKSVYASVVSNFTKCNINKALKKIDNSIYLVGGEYSDDIADILEEYKEHNPAIETTIIADAKKYPQLEAPAKLFDLIHTYFG
ncbi:MAG: alpha/beta hydrolase [Eubacteriales bacterium]|nr:alpha/beta hydrolase [Eubacteriales bacterium]